MRPHWMLHELGLAYETKEILTRSEGMQDLAFQALNQRNKLPVFEDDGLVIGESGAILFYLADRYRDRAALAPAPATRERAPATRERARFDDLCLFTLTELDATLYVIRRHEGLPSIYGSSATACEAARQYFLRGAGELQRQLADGRAYLLGDAFSAVDILVTTCLDWASFVAVELPDVLQDYQQRIAQRDAYAKAMARNFPPAALEALRSQAEAEAKAV